MFKWFGSLTALWVHSLGVLLLAGCQQPAEAVDKADPQHAAFLTVSEQHHIALASRELWADANPKADWSDIVNDVVVACGNTLRLDEAFVIISYHPRTAYDWQWRGPVESELFRRATWAWTSTSVPRCALIRRAVGRASTSFAPERS